MTQSRFQSSSFVTLWASMAAFSTYFCVYAFRKGFTVGVYEGDAALGFLGEIDLKILFIVAQTMGQAASKFLGIKWVSETPAERRVPFLLYVMLICFGSLVLFAVVPTPYKLLAMFINGFTQGWVWGLVFGVLEGRRTTDVLGVALCASFIVAGGVTRTISKIVLDMGVSEYLMPTVVGLIFTLPFLFSTWMLHKVPRPTQNDEAHRTKRMPMNRQQRLAFFRKYALGVIALTIIYALLTAFREFRDNFAREIWDALGFSDAPQIMTTTELPVAVGSLVILGSIVLINDNRRALQTIFTLMLVGLISVAVATWAWQIGWLGPEAWMITVGIGFYIGYVAFNSVLFDRLIAALGSVGTVAFLIYLADAAGYFVNSVVLLYKNFVNAQLPWIDFFVRFAYLTAIVCGVLTLVSIFYFNKKTQRTG